ncbi:MAG: conjugal transfer protein [Oscillospiraceae bacterium]|nr:conjugal transfer protein [Oscillospiraceae bacterium]
MEFFNSAIDTLSTIICALGSALIIWGLVSIGQNHGDQDPASRSIGMRQLIGGGIITLVGLVLVPQLANIF